MKCPFCGATEKQERLGQLPERPHIVYRCNVCDELYARLEENDDSGQSNGEQ